MVSMIWQRSSQSRVDMCMSEIRLSGTSKVLHRSAKSQTRGWKRGSGAGTVGASERFRLRAGNGMKTGPWQGSPGDPQQLKPTRRLALVKLSHLINGVQVKNAAGQFEA